MGRTAVAVRAPAYKVILSVQNDRTTVLQVDPWLLKMLDKELRYPTTVVSMRDPDIVVPPTSNPWDGWVRLLNRPKAAPPWFPTGLLPRVSRLAGKFGHTVSVQDARERPEPGFPELIDIPLRDYQQEAVRRALYDGRGVLDMPPRSGKTRTMMEIQRGISLPTVWIAPTDRIVTQTREGIEGFFGPRYVTHLIGSSSWKKAAESEVVVCTAATADRLPDEFYKTREMIAVDEWHHAAAKQYHRIFDKCPHIFYRYGMTGTFYRSGPDVLSLHALLSQTLYKISSLELLERGYLVPCHVVFLPVPAPRLRGLPSTTYQKGHGKYGIQEHTPRNHLIADCILQLYAAGRRVLVLVGTKKQGRIINDLVKPFIPGTDRSEFDPVEFVSTDRPRDVQGRILEAFEAGQEVKVLIGTSLLGEGVDLPSADALVYARGEKAEVTLMQNLYRVCTAVPGKTNAIVVDFADRHHKKLIEHSEMRLATYYREPTFTTTVLDDAKKFEKWFNFLARPAT